MIRICPERDARCPHGMACPYALDEYSCKAEKTDRLAGVALTDHLTWPAAMAEVARLRAELSEMTRRRDEWSAKAKGYDALRAAVRAGMAQAGSRSFSRVALRGALVESERSLSAASAAWMAVRAAETVDDLIATVAALDAALGTEGRDRD